MNLKEFSNINRLRCEAGFHHQLSAWSTAEWTNAMAGEAGEACNVAKKLLRHRDGISGNYKPDDKYVEVLRRKCAEEVADTIIYADLVIQSLGFDTSEILSFVFNRKSDELGTSIKVSK